MVPASTEKPPCSGRGRPDLPQAALRWGPNLTVPHSPGPAPSARAAQDRLVGCGRPCCRRRCLGF